MLKFIIGISISVIFLILFFRVIDISVITLLIKDYPYRYLLFSILFLSISYFYRVYRWYNLMQMLSEKVTIKNCISPMIGSLALNGILPFRGGDLVRVFIFSKNMQVQNSNVMASMIIERVFDLVLILLLLIFSIIFIEFTNIPNWISISVLSIASIIIFITFLTTIFREKTNDLLLRTMKYRIFSEYAPFRKTLEFLFDTFLKLGLLTNTSSLLKMLFYSLIIWLTQAAVFIFIILGLNNQFDFLAGLFSSSVTAIATVIPSSPGYFGSFHYAALQSYDLIYQSKNLAGAFAILSHAVFWLPTTIVGLVMIFFDKKYLNILNKEL